MKTWALTLVFAALFAGLAPHLLPKGDKSPLYQPLAFMISLAVLILLSQPLVALIREPDRIRQIDFAAADESLTYDPGKMLLERSETSVEKKVREAFPEGDYAVVFDTDEEGLGIKAIRVETNDRALGEEIALWLVDNGLAVF